MFSITIVQVSGIRLCSVKRGKLRRDGPCHLMLSLRQTSKRRGNTFLSTCVLNITAIQIWSNCFSGWVHLNEYMPQPVKIWKAVRKQYVHVCTDWNFIFLNFCESYYYEQKLLTCQQNKLSPFCFYKLLIYEKSIKCNFACQYGCYLSIHAKYVFVRKNAIWTPLIEI